MADIKQAAEWMREGKKVRRSPWVSKSVFCMKKDESLQWRYGKEALPLRVTMEELLADDWRIAEREED